jgi:poly(3-hydroxybutyrate) depolymerase
MPYALFVPSTYDPKKPAPLVVDLHGLNITPLQQILFDGTTDFAERGGFIILAPMGFDLSSWWGSRPGKELAEIDAMTVVKLIREKFAIDSNRIYLMGHSMGGAGTYYLGGKYNDLWAGLAVISGAGGIAEGTADRYKSLATLIMHGEKDSIVPAANSRRAVAALEAVGAPHTYLEFPGKDHEFWIRRGAAQMEQVFAFFNTVSKQTKAATAPSVTALPSTLSDAEFWALSQRLSEPNGFFVSRSGSPDHLLSNENTISTVAAELAARVKPGGVYLGVGPEQNFTYMAATRPRFAIVTDIRRGNLDLHLVYKAVFGLSASRSEFAARLFSRRPIAASTPTTTSGALMDAVRRSPALDDAGFRANLAAVVAYLAKTHALPLGKDDLDGIEYVYETFHRFGPDINYTSSINGRSGSFASYGMIQALTDASGVSRTYLASDDAFAFVKQMEAKNLIVPIVGDFAGPKALRAVGAYLKEHGALVSVFYVSNVEMYLEQNGKWPAFCANAASLPTDAASLFIRPGGRGASWFGSIAAETRSCG